MQDLDAVRAAFTDPEEFWSSPLYRRLSAVVAGDAFLIGLAAHARAGQGPTFAFLGAVHALLLAGAEHPLADFYPSVRGDSALAPDDAGPAFTGFAHEHSDEICAVLQTRLVQTNHVQRAVGLRLGLAAVAAQVRGRPVHLLEVGASAGLVLRHASYGYELGGRAFGDRHSPVQLVSEWRSTEPVPDLDDVPHLASTTGVDLNPLDPGGAADRRWLEALVWPENRNQAQLLHTALTVAADTPVTVLQGDAVDVCPSWAATVPSGEARVVFHCATRMHVPAGRRALFDAAIRSAGRDGPLWHIAVEGDGLVVTDPTRRSVRLFDVDGHLAWARRAAVAEVDQPPR